MACSPDVEQATSVVLPTTPTPVDLKVFYLIFETLKILECSFTNTLLAQAKISKECHLIRPS